MLRILLFVYFVSSNTLLLASEMTGQQWLEKMSQAMKSLEYQGTVAFFKNGRLDTMKYFHAIENGVTQERLLSLNTPMREVVREAGSVRCIFKDARRSVVNHYPVSDSFIINLPDNFASVSNVYQFTVLANESVAMREVQVISIVAKDNYRYGKKVWIDKEYFLPLKMEVYDLSGVTLEQIVFTELQVDADVEFIATDSSVENGYIKNIHKSGLPVINDASFMTGNIPQGFQMAFFTRMKEHVSAKSVEHLLLTDGFSSISVYLEDRDSDSQEGLQALGSVNSYTYIIDDVQVTAMGEVPAAAVRFVAQGVTLLRR